MTEEQTVNEEKPVLASAKAAYLVKRIAKDAMAVDDIVMMYQSEVDKLLEENKTLRAELAEAAGKTEEN